MSCVAKRLLTARKHIKKITSAIMQNPAENSQGMLLVPATKVTITESTTATLVNGEK
jgi:hypothetical protein